MSAGCLESRPAVFGLFRASARPILNGAVTGPDATSHAAVDWNTTPQTRSLSVPGKSAQKRIRAIPPIEWPTTTASRRSSVSSRQCRSSARDPTPNPCLPGVDLPWPRQSGAITRNSPPRSLNWFRQIDPLSVTPCKSTMGWAPSGPRSRRNIRPPSLVAMVRVRVPGTSARASFASSDRSPVML